ncbi:MAG: hypothetical protein AB1671_23770 [Thermodesulfobacteriota bacterium]|jgi:hypothetical protein
MARWGHCALRAQAWVAVDNSQHRHAHVPLHQLVDDRLPRLGCLLPG